MNNNERTTVHPFSLRHIIIIIINTIVKRMAASPIAHTLPTAHDFLLSGFWLFLNSFFDTPYYLFFFKGIFRPTRVSVDLNQQATALDSSTPNDHAYQLAHFNDSSNECIASIALRASEFACLIRTRRSSRQPKLASRRDPGLGSSRSSLRGLLPMPTHRLAHYLFFFFLCFNGLGLRGNQNAEHESVEMGALWASSSHGVSRARDQPVVFSFLAFVFRFVLGVYWGCALFSRWVASSSSIGARHLDMSNKRLHDTTVELWFEKRGWGWFFMTPSPPRNACRAWPNRRFSWGHAWACPRRATCPFGQKQQADLLAMTVPLGAHSEFSFFFFSIVAMN